MTRPALNPKTIFGIKLRRCREAQQLTLAELARRAGMSISYLAEIESGKKYPKTDKILQLSRALGCGYDELISSKLDQEFDALQELLTSPGLRDFPFELFGLPADDLMRLLTRSPAEVAALLRTLADIASEYNLGVEHFLHAALRSYQELTGNYYEDIEVQAETFARKVLGRSTDPAQLSRGLRQWLQRNCVDEIDDRGLAAQPALADFRSVLCPRPRPRLLLNPQLSESQRTFALAREAGYKVLGLRARSLTMPPDREDSFEQVLSDFKASYFAGALVLPRQRLLSDLCAWLKRPSWQPRAMLELLAAHRVSSETFMYRLSQLLPGHFGLRPHFLKTLEEGGRLRVTKHMNLTGLPVGAGFNADEHHCRRRLGARLLQELAQQRQRAPLAGALRCRLVGREVELFSIGLCQPQPQHPPVGAAFTLSFADSPTLYRTIRFAADRKVPLLLIGRTCEQCPLTPAECPERAAPPTRYLQRLARVDRQRELRMLIGEE